jgi:molecular chaperone DnaK
LKSNLSLRQREFLVRVQFEIDGNGTLHVLARDIGTGRERIVQMKSAVDVSDEAVESMLAESLEHAFDDVSERIWTETRVKSEEMLTSVDSALQIVGDKIGTSEKKKILRLGYEVRKAMESRQAQKLKEANEALDAGTQHLAALVVEQAMATANRPGSRTKDTDD